MNKLSSLKWELINRYFNFLSVSLKPCPPPLNRLLTGIYCGPNQRNYHPSRKKSFLSKTAKNNNWCQPDSISTLIWSRNPRPIVYPLDASMTTKLNWYMARNPKQAEWYLCHWTRMMLFKENWQWTIYQETPQNYVSLAGSSLVHPQKRRGRSDHALTSSNWTQSVQRTIPFCHWHWNRLICSWTGIYIPKTGHWPHMHTFEGIRKQWGQTKICVLRRTSLPLWPFHSDQKNVHLDTYSTSSLKTFLVG